MIRTRDFILFVITFCFLVLAIIFTVTSHRGGFLSVAFNETTSQDAGGVIEIEEVSEEETRQSTIARLREKIKNAPILSSSAPSVVTPDVVIASSSESESGSLEETVDGTVVALQMCPGATDGLTVAQAWPRTGVTVSEVEGVRVATYTDAMGVKQLLLLPLYPNPSGQNCLTSEIIGLTKTGSLIFNSDAIAYQASGAETLIGYALDGVAIYGLYTGVTDACGGYDHPSGYRYSLSPERPFMIGCYMASPAMFSL